MDYQKMCNFYTQEKIPNVWKKAVVAEKTSEILIYSVIAECLESFSDVFVELDVETDVAKVLMSWKRKEQIDFGRHALQLTSPKDNKIELRCIYDIDEIKEDMEMLAYDMFGTIDPEKVGEKSLYDDAVEIPDEMINSFVKGIQKKKMISEQN